MCTVIVEVPADPRHAARLLAVRDEDPARPWDAPGPWWPSAHPGVIGVRDRRADGAWLAADRGAGRLAVILNRAEEVVSADGGPLASRGGIVLDSVAGTPPQDPPATAAFNLIEAHGASVSMTSWNGSELRRERLSPGIHMVAHHELDDPRTPRIVRWRPAFEALASTGDPALPFREWSAEWIAALARSSELDPADDRAIIRDNSAHGFPTLSLLACVAEVREHGLELASAPLAEPGRWGDPAFTPA